MTVKFRKKLIEVALPLQAINTEALRRKQKAPKGWPTSFHKWWAQRPLAAARAVIFAQMVDDPSSCPDLFPTQKKQERERQRLFKIIEDLVQWDNTNDEKVLQAARDEIWQSWRRTCAENVDHPRAKELFSRQKLPCFWDPFAGSGSLPLSAQWLGLDSYASDLNPVAVLINKAMIEIPPMFAGKPPVNPEWRKNSKQEQALTQWRGAAGLAEDVRYYAQWMREEAEKRIGHLYPKIEVTAKIIADRPDLKNLAGEKLTVVAWIWVRTVKSPNPAFNNVEVPLAASFLLSSKPGKEAYVEPVIEGGDYRFVVKVGKPKDSDAVLAGTKLARGANFRCVMSGTPIAGDHIKSEGMAGRMGARLMAIVAEGERGRVYLSPTPEQEKTPLKVKPEWKPDQSLPNDPRNFWTVQYGLATYGDLFMPRQLVGLTTFSDLVIEAIQRIRQDALDADVKDDSKPLRDGGVGASAYAEAIAVYLACVVDRMVYYGSSLTSWLPKDNALRDCMPRQALAMTWDFAEGNPLAKSSGDIGTCSKAVANYLDFATPASTGHAMQCDAQTGIGGNAAFVISTDPPYYDNICYADLSDFFYLWLRRSLKPIFPELFATLAVPKAEELVATPYRHGGKEKAEAFFLKGMTHAMERLREQSNPALPVTIYYAFKQSEDEGEDGTASTGWQTFLEAVMTAGFAISGTWPLRTEGAGRMIASGTNALASSIILVCRPRPVDAATATRREFVAKLKQELPESLRHLQAGNIAPVDLAQASIGPGMGVFTRYARVLDAQGNPMAVREALALINEVLDEALAEQEGDFDADSRWALAWFEQFGFTEGEFGVAEILTKAKNTSVQGLDDAGILKQGHGKVRLLKPDELPEDWDPDTDDRLTNWETVHHLIRVLGSGGESAASELVAKLGNKAEAARELAYRLYTLCERKKRATDALAYNGLVQSWPELIRLAQQGGKPKAAEKQDTMFKENE